MSSLLPSVSPPILFAAILATTLLLFTRSRLRHDLVGILALFACVAAGLVSANDAFAGFGHPAVITIASVLILSRALGETSLFDAVARGLRRRLKRGTSSVFSLASLTAVLSGFMNNTGALTLTLPTALRISKETGFPKSRLLMPISFASLLGGLVTLIGTPPNIVIAQVRARVVGEPFALFDFAPVGGAIALAGIAYLTLIGWRFLPKRHDSEDRFERGHLQNYVTELKVPLGSKAVGFQITMLEASVRNELSVLAVLRGGHNVVAPPGYFVLAADDILLVESAPETLSESLRQTGLKVEGQESTRPRLRESDMIEAVVTPNSMLVGRSVLDFRLRQRLGVNLIGVARKGDTVLQRVRRVSLATGDVLLLQGPRAALNNSLQVAGLLPLRGELADLHEHARGPLVLLLFLAALGCVGFGWVPVHIAFAGVVVAGVLTRQIPAAEVYSSVDWSIVIFIGAMIPVGAAFETSGASALAVEPLLQMAEGRDPLIALLCLMAATMLLSDFLNNTAIAVLMAPVAIALAGGLGVALDPFLMAVAVAASCTFLTPIGHQSNLIVMGPGGYRFGDYWRLGLVMDAIVLVVSAYAIPHFWPF